MDPKRFRGATADEARRNAETQLGAPPVIIDSARVPRKGIAGLLGFKDIEVSVAPPPKPAPAAPKRPFGARLYETEAPPKPVENDLIRADLRQLRSAVARAESTLPRIMSELSALRENMPTNKTPARAVRGRAATTAFLAERGFTGDVARRISTLMHDKRVSAQASTDTERFREALSTFLRVAPFPVPAEGRQVITLVGRTGVGKTTTAAKLAARAVFDHEQTVTLIAADTQRVGASYQLKRFATLIGAEFAAVGPEQSLTELVQACTSDLVIVDTSGSSSPEELAGLAANVTNRAAWVLACIPAGVSELETEATITRLGGLRPTGLIITKLDECHRPTALAAAPAISGLPVHAITNGPRVPEDIAPATMSGLLDALSGPTAPSASRPRTARAA